MVDSADEDIGKIFVTLVDGDQSSELLPFTYDHTYVQESTRGGSDRLLIGPLGRHTELLLELAKQAFAGPIALLYVLVVPASDHLPGRYYSEDAFAWSDISSLFARYKDFLALDGRHHLWLIDAESPKAFLIYDRHNVIYAYGNLASYVPVLEQFGLRPGEVKHPGMHAHAYHRQFDAAERQLLAEFPWRYETLKDRDDQ